MASKRSKRKAALEALDNMRVGSPLSPQKGISRNPKGYNANKCRLFSEGVDSEPNSGSANINVPKNLDKTQKYRRRRLKRWDPRKGDWNLKLREQVVQQNKLLKQQENLRRINDCKQNMQEIERRYKRKNVPWQATVVFTLFAVMLQWYISLKPFTMIQLAEFVGLLVVSRPNKRVVQNLYNSWRLTRSFKPLHRGKPCMVYLDDYPMVRRKVTSWARRRLLKRRKNEEALTAIAFCKKINSLFIKFNVLNSTGNKPLEWSTSTALRFMHKVKLEYGGYTKGYCDGHDREDVLESLAVFIEEWYKLEPRMHLWIKQVDLSRGIREDVWRHVDEFKLQGPGSLDRNNLEGSFGGACKVGVEGHPLPAERPLLVFANDEVIFRTKRCNPHGWKIRDQSKLRPKDYFGTGRMISGFAHEFLGFIELTPHELMECNVSRAQRGLPPIKHRNVCVKKFDYGKNREVG